MVPHSAGQQVTWEITTEIKGDKASVEDYKVLREGFQNIGLEKNRMAIFEMAK
jgi:hypothetical protein